MNRKNEFRPLSSNETELLLKNGCRCNNWADVLVSEGFNPRFYTNVRFSGKIKIGSISKTFESDYRPDSTPGIDNASIHNCTIGENVSIKNIGDYIADYSIEDNVCIRNCGKISVEGKTSFGNGTPVSVLNENGKRSIKIWDRLSAQQAYIMTLYKQRRRVLEALDNIIDKYTKAVTSTIGTIGKDSTITNSGQIVNVKIGPNARIDGVTRLTEGSVNSTASAPVVIGSGVIMDKFIISSGSSVTDSALIESSFIGQGCFLGKQFTAEHSLFFANCECTRSEASCVFAGPFTVTHHKATLLLTAMYSFMNAGSGTNHSNHMYKLGPVHQGIVERGSKTTSGSYVMWPAHIGAFTMIMGRHYKNYDTSALPFSYLIEENKEGLLFPAVNIKSVGTYRDEQKWQQRDKRKGIDIIDKVNYRVLSPYTVGKIIKGRDILRNLESDNNSSDKLSYNNVTIKKSSLKKGIALYQAALDRYLGSLLVERLGNNYFKSIEELKRALIPDIKEGAGKWIDLAGLLVPEEVKDTLLSDIETGKIIDSESLSDSFEFIHNSYKQMEWRWAADCFRSEYGKSPDDFNSEDFVKAVERWKKSSTELDKLMIEDAQKEFSEGVMTGYGVDGDAEAKRLDFEKVRGDFKTNPVVKAIKDRMAAESLLAEELIARIKRIKLK